MTDTATAPLPKGDGTESWHGTVSGYTYRECRCALCRKAWSRANLASRKRRSQEPIPEHVHGTANGYNNYRCRCDECRAAWAQRARDWRASVRDRAAA